jgi:hypothetical protein
MHLDLWVRHLLYTGAGASSTSRRMSALASLYNHLLEHDLIATNLPPPRVARVSTPTTPRPSGSTGNRPAPSSPPPTPTCRPRVFPARHHGPFPLVLHNQNAYG